jgi:large subunit ribosomal protein L16
MGSGSGSIEYFMFSVKPGRVIFEVSGVSEEITREAFRIASHKLPFQTKFVTRNEFI